MQISTKLGMKGSERLKRIILCSNDNPGLTWVDLDLDLFCGDVIFCNYGFVWDNVTMMDSFESIASSNLELAYAVN